MVSIYINILHNHKVCQNKLKVTAGTQIEYINYLNTFFCRTFDINYIIKRMV